MGERERFRLPLANNKFLEVETLRDQMSKLEEWGETILERNKESVSMICYRF